MDRAEIGGRTPHRIVNLIPPRMRTALALSAVTVLGVALFGATGALGSPRPPAATTLHLTGEVTTAKKAKPGDPASKDFSNIALRSGSKAVGQLALRNCNGLAINELACSGKITLTGIGSGLEVVVRWPCEIIGESGKFTCASVGEGFITAKQSERGTIRIATAEENLYTTKRHFPVTIKAGP